MDPEGLDDDPLEREGERDAPAGTNNTTGGGGSGSGAGAGAAAAAGNGGAGQRQGEREREETGCVQVGNYEACSSKREIGGLAVWSVSSLKPGNGVEYLRDNLTKTFWQSDGVLPHALTIEFQRKVRVLEVVVYVDYRNDESYTPQKISLRIGSSPSDLYEITEVELEEPQGWVVIPLNGSGSMMSTSGFVRTHCLQLAVLSNHQNGRDTHLRQVKVFGPRIDVTRSADQPFSFTNPEFTQFETAR